MSLTKRYYEDEADKVLDAIASKLKKGSLSKEQAVLQIQNSYLLKLFADLDVRDTTMVEEWIDYITGTRH